MDGFEQHATDFSFEGVNPRYHNQSYINGDRWSSTNTSEFPPINRPRLVKIVSFWLTLLLVGLICAIIYLEHIRETKTRYYISHGKLAILQEYSTALGNKESMEYKSLTASFCSEMDKSFRSSRLHTNTYRMCIVTNLRPGSVIVTFTLYFDATVDLSDTEVIKTINNSVQHIGSKNMLGNYPIDINGISVTTTLTLYEQDPIPFLEPDSDFIIPPTTKQTTPSTAVTSTSTIPATVTTAISPADTTETKKTTTSSTETTKVTTVLTQPITKTTKSTTTMPMTTTAETTTYSHTEAITTLLTSTTEPKTTTTLPSTVTTKLTTTIPLTTTTEGTTSSHASPTTTITSSLAPTVTTKPTTTIELPTSTQDTKATTFVPTITTEATTSTNLPPTSTTKATTLTPFTSSTEAKTTTIMSLITTEATASLSPTTETKTTTTEAKTTTTFSPSTRTEQTTPTVKSEVTTTATGSPVVTTEESREELTTISPAKLNETTVSATLPTTKAAITISTHITSNTSTTKPVNETTETLTTLPPTKTTEAKMSTTLPTTVKTREETSMPSTLTGNSTTISFDESTGTTTDMPPPETTDVLMTITPIKTTKTTVLNTSPTTKEDTTITTNTTSNMSTTIPVKETTEAKTTVSNTSPTTKEDTTIPTNTTSNMSTTIPVKETTEAKTTVSNISPTTKEDTTISTKTTSNMSTTIPVKETTEALTTMPPTTKTEATISAVLQTTKETTSMSSTTTSKTTFALEKTTEALTTMPITETTEAEVQSTLPTIETSVITTSIPSTLTGDATTTVSLVETTETSILSTNFMSTESHGASTMSEIITTVPSGPMSTNTDISVETTLGSTSVSVKNNTLSSNDTTVPTDSSAESSLDSTTTVETSSIISHTVSDNATAEPTVLPTSDISTLISTEEITVKNTTREATTSKDTTEATVTNTTSEDTTREVTTKATTASTTAAAATNTTREDITTALVTNTTNDVTTENTITMTTSEFTTGITLNTTTEYTTEPAVTNTTKEYTTKPTVSNTTNEFTTEPTFTNTTREDTTVVNSSGDTTGTSSIATTVSQFTADVMFPSKNILASEDTTLECVITVTDQWEKVTINQETETDFVFLAEFYNNGSVFSQVTTEFLSVVFKQDNETIETIIYINLQNSSSCPSLLHFDCGIIMEDTFKSVITKTSILSITAPLHNITLDMANVYYSGERLELICRTITDFEYGDVALEVRSPNGLVFREPAPRTQYALTRNSDCSVNFEWKFKSGISLASSLNGSTVWCIASNRLLNTSVSTSQLITVLVSDVSFSQYYVPGSVGKQVMIECETTTLTSNIAKMAVYKTLNGTNETIASYSSGNNNNTNSRSDISVTFQGGMLTLTFFSLKCSDEGLYICVVKTGSSEVSTPLSLTLQPTVLAGSTAVSLSLNTDIVENYYRYTSEHSCTGEIGYPDAGFLSLSAIHPTSGETVVYNEEVVTDAMKVKDRLVGSDIYSYGVTLAKDFRILVKEDRKVQENCSTIHKVRFFLNVSREWSRGRFRCEIRTKEGRIPTSLQEEQFYVIPSDVCDAYNKTKQVFIDHEKNDNCNTYIQCGDEAPYGKKCSNPRYCVFIGKDYCDECVRAICTETPTTTARPVPTTEAARGFSYLDCNSSSVSEGESASIGCHLNSSSFVSLNILKSEFTIASIQVDGSVMISPNYQGKLFAILDLPSLLLVVTINTVTCSDDGIYNVTLQLDSGNVTSTTFKVNMKVKPKNPTLSLNPSLVDGENSLSHSCTGNVGNPPGSLQIQIRRSADSNFTEYSTPRQIKSSSLESAGNCSYIKTLSFSIDLTTESWSNMTIRCVALNTVSLEDDDPVPSSILYTRTSISSEFCENKNKTYYDYHPMGCPFYVWCVTGRPYGQVCAANDLCMNPVSGDCERKK